MRMTSRTASQLRESPEMAIFAAMKTQTNGAAPALPEATGTAEDAAPDASAPNAKRPREIGGPKGPEPTRYGDWEFNGRCTDF